MTELTDILAKPLAPRACKFSLWIESLPDVEQKAVVDALANPDWTTRGLTTTLRKFGASSDEKTVSRHRKNECEICGPVGSA